jgi:Zn-dependent protease with chaperone function
MRRFMPLTGGLTVSFAIVLIVLGFVLLGYYEVGPAVLLLVMGLGGLVLVPVGFWVVRRRESASSK